MRSSEINQLVYSLKKAKRWAELQHFFSELERAIEERPTPDKIPQVSLWIIEYKPLLICHGEWISDKPYIIHCSYSEQLERYLSKNLVGPLEVLYPVDNYDPSKTIAAGFQSAIAYPIDDKSEPASQLDILHSDKSFGLRILLAT